MLWQSWPLLDNTQVKLFVWNDFWRTSSHLQQDPGWAISDLSSKIAKNNLIHLWAVSPTEIYLSNWNQNKSNAVILPTSVQSTPSAHIVILCFNYKILPLGYSFVWLAQNWGAHSHCSQSLLFVYYADWDGAPGREKTCQSEKIVINVRTFRPCGRPSLAPLKIYNWF